MAVSMGVSGSLPSFPQMAVLASSAGAVQSISGQASSFQLHFSLLSANSQLTPSFEHVQLAPVHIQASSPLASGHVGSVVPKQQQTNIR